VRIFWWRSKPPASRDAIEACGSARTTGRSPGGVIAFASFAMFRQAETKYARVGELEGSHRAWGSGTHPDMPAAGEASARCVLRPLGNRFSWQLSATRIDFTVQRASYNGNTQASQA
jgi:hypothetical protein